MGCGGGGGGGRGGGGGEGEGESLQEGEQKPWLRLGYGRVTAEIPIHEPFLSNKHTGVRCVCVRVCVCVCVWCKVCG